MEKTVYKFLKDHYNPDKPLLLGLSGGPDSLALFHLLLNYRQKEKMVFGIAHVDHGWRPESGHEAKILEELASNHNLQFHLKKLNPTEMHGNLEASCREARLSFFDALCRQHGYQAVILGHHAGDQAETVLKRVMEGGSLPYLCGLREVTTIHELSIWRPFLRIRKDKILDWISAHGLKPFEDSTNIDPKFLRGKFRTRILPLLSSEFGKQIDSSLEHIGSEALELQSYLDLRLKDVLSKIEYGKRGLYLDLSSQPHLHAFEMKYLIRKFCEEADLSLSRVCVETLGGLIRSQAADRKIIMGDNLIHVDRGRIFLMHSNQKEAIQGICLLKPGRQQYGNWAVSVKNDSEKKNITNWKCAWDGKCEVWLPEGEYHLGPALLSTGYRGSTPISKWWTNAKVPAFLRHLIPVIWEGNKIKAEYLSGREPQLEKAENKKWLSISLLLDS